MALHGRVWRVFDEQPLDARHGWISLLKGRAAEHLMAYETGGGIHSEWNVLDHDVVTPEGDLIQVKTGSRVYIEDNAGAVHEDITIHTGSGRAGVPDVSAHDWSAAELQEQINTVDSASHDTLELLGRSVVVGMVLSGGNAFRELREGRIELNNLPRCIVVESAGNTVRRAIIGVAATSHSPVIVTAGVSCLLYRNRTVLTRL